EQYFFERPDLVTTGRTLFGAKPPKGHELDDHYFGTIPERILACMLDCERELAKLGVPIKTRHNEVAPNQYEIAPIFENSNVGSDHQQLTMQLLQNIARRYGLVCLLHEKPFAGVNGSGKHNNWSMGTNTGINLLEPGDTPSDNLQFLFFCTAVVQAVNKHQALLRASIANVGQDHRLGANEAPPAIVSIFLGGELDKVFEAIDEMSDKLEAKISGGMDTAEAAIEVVKETYVGSKQICFSGDNYSEEWHAEAEQRGLKNLKTTPDALLEVMADDSVAAFEKYSVLSKRELESRFEVWVEQYALRANIEAETTFSIAKTMLLPAALRHLALISEAGVSSLEGEVRGLIEELSTALDALEKANAEPTELEGLELATFARDEQLTKSGTVREAADKLEKVVADDLWPLPKYEEMLFIK
ncbi:MAG TPA: glutamine synthetase type III, partial [Solirubrobacterales bacterium]|nr:glutamine synthetase type III [Solirubrobacterales bacterium]